MIVWINGTVGAGKSHVAQKLAGLLAEKDAEYIESDLYWADFIHDHFNEALSGFEPYYNRFFLNILRKTIEEKMYGAGKTPIVSLSLVTKLCEKELLDYFEKKDVPMHHIILEATKETIISRIENDPIRDRNAQAQQTPKISQHIEYLGTEYSDAVRINTGNKDLDEIAAEIVTMASADFSQFVVATANVTACETSRDKSVFFPRLPSQFTHMGYGYLLGFAVTCQLTRHIRLNIRFLSVGLRFFYLFFSPAPHDTNLESRYKVRW